jgi:long-subunit acyl-CoA synthetase (AMP-forming)
VGFPLFHIDARIVDELGVECFAEEVRDVLIRSPLVCAGYRNRPDETARPFGTDGCTQATSRDETARGSSTSSGV